MGLRARTHHSELQWRREVPGQCDLGWPFQTGGREEGVLGRTPRSWAMVQSVNRCGLYRGHYDRICE